MVPGLHREERCIPSMVPGLHEERGVYPAWYPGYMRGESSIPSMVPGLHERRVVYPPWYPDGHERCNTHHGTRTVMRGVTPWYIPPGYKRDVPPG